MHNYFYKFVVPVIPDYLMMEDEQAAEKWLGPVVNSSWLRELHEKTGPVSARNATLVQNDTSGEIDFIEKVSLVEEILTTIRVGSTTLLII